MSGEAPVVADRFVLGELLGSGGSASVYAAHDRRTGQDVALKLLHAHLCDRPAAREAFFAGPRRAMLLRHPNIVTVLEISGEGSSGHAWISQERVDGATLASRVADDGPLSAADAISVTIGVLRALTAVHAHGLVHRDVTPTNIMIDDSPDGPLLPVGVRLIDFGLADLSGRSALGTDELLSARASGRAGILGNVNYVSPEQARGEPIDPAGDLYQCGAVLYFALTGNPPFPRDTAVETIRAHLETAPAPSSAITPGVPRELDRVILRAMMKDPDDRFSSADGMLRALLGAMDGSARTAILPAVPTSRTRETPPATPDVDRSPTSPSTIAPLPPRAGRARTWMAAALVAAAALVLVTVLVNRTPSVSVAEEPGRGSTPVASPTASPSSPTPGPSTAIVADRSVPDLARMTLSEAEQALAEAGLAVGLITWADAASVRDTVLESDPVAGSSLARGARVALVVATGLHTVPDVRGMGREEAASSLQSAGFVPSFPGDSDPALPAGERVVGTDPADGSVRAVGSTVHVLFGVLSTPTATPTPTLPAVTPTPTVGAAP